jgi:hypothetical protein
LGIYTSEIGKILGNFQLGQGSNFGPKSGQKKNTVLSYVLESDYLALSIGLSLYIVAHFGRAYMSDCKPGGPQFELQRGWWIFMDYNNYGAVKSQPLSGYEVVVVSSGAKKKEECVVVLD